MTCSDGYILLRLLCSEIKKTMYTIGLQTQTSMSRWLFLIVYVEINLHDTDFKGELHLMFEFYVQNVKLIFCDCYSDDWNVYEQIPLENCETGWKVTACSSPYLKIFWHN